MGQQPKCPRHEAADYLDQYKGENDDECPTDPSLISRGSSVAMTVMMSVAVVMIMRVVIVAGCSFRRGMKIGLLVMVRFQGERKLCLRNDFGQSPFQRAPTTRIGERRVFLSPETFFRNTVFR